MTTCRTDESWIRLTAGQAADDERAELLAHIETCPRCAERYREFSSIWELLGVWGVQPPPRDMLPDVLRRMQERHQPAWAGWMRVAASVALAAGIGTVAGLATPIGHHAAGSVTTEELIEQVGLNAFTSDAAIFSGLFMPWEDDELPEGQS